MDASSSRRDRLVMGLSIAALLLFAANLISMVKHHFFDSSAEYEVQLVEDTQHRAIFVAPDGKEHRISIHVTGNRGEHFEWSHEMSLEHDMQALRRDMEQLARDLEGEFEHMQLEIHDADLERVQELKLRLEDEHDAVREAVEQARQAAEEAAEQTRRERRIVIRR